MQEKQQSSIQATLLKSLGPETTPKQSPLNGPLLPKIQPVDRRKFSLDFDYKKRVRDQDLMKMMKGKLQNWLLKPDQQTSRRMALGIRDPPPVQRPAPVVQKRATKAQQNQQQKQQFQQPRPVGMDLQER